jgi:hypothetical protein
MANIPSNDGGSDSHKSKFLTVVVQPSTNITTQASSPTLLETPWTDAQIRWSEEDGYPITSIGNDVDIDNNNNNNNNNNTFLDPFADPDPTQVFTFTFTVTAPQQKDVIEETYSKFNTTTTTSTTTTTTLDLKIQGYKTHSDPVWQSTGLTLWKAAKYLCDYMVNHSAALQRRRILEVSTWEEKHMHSRINTGGKGEGNNIYW